MKVVNKNFKKYQQKMQESKLFDDENVLVEADKNEKSEDGLTDEELREISLDIAIDISKLMEKVSPDDILDISRDVAKYIKFHVIGEEYEANKMNKPEREDEEVERPVDSEAEDFDILDDIDDEEPEEFEIEDDEEAPEDSEETNEQGNVISDEFII